MKAQKLTAAVLAMFLFFNVSVEANAKAKQVPVTTLPLILNSSAYGKKNSAIGHRYEKHQYARTYLWLLEDGSICVKTRFENGKKVDGDHFFAIITFRNAQHEVLGHITQRTGLNAMFLGSAQKRTVISRTTMSDEELQEVAFVEFRYGHFDSKPDRELWDAVQKAGEKIVATTA